MTDSRSFLFITWEGGGNVPPVLGVARRLARRGHRIRVLTEPCLEESVTRAGATFLPFRRHFTRTDRAVDIVGDWQARSPVGALKRAFDNVMFGPARIVAEETLQSIKEEVPDVVVVDLNMPGALLAAESARLPCVVLFHMPEYLPGSGRPAGGPGFLPRTDLVGRFRDGLMVRMFYNLLGKYLAGFNDVRKDLGLAPLRSSKEIIDLFHRVDRRLIQTSEAFDFPITPPPQNVRYVGPVLDDPDWSPGTWENPWPENDPGPLVVVSLGSTFQNQKDLFQRAISSLDTLDVRGLVTLGPAMAGATFDVPGNVKIVPSVPHGMVFPYADAVISHGGHGTVIRALAHGVPLVCLPMGRDQKDNGARVTAKGVGIRLSPAASPQKIREAVRRLLREPGFRSRAREMKEIITEDAASDRAVHELENVAKKAMEPAA